MCGTEPSSSDNKNHKFHLPMDIKKTILLAAVWLAEEYIDQMSKKFWLNRKEQIIHLFEDS